eukprot:XP_001706088.1 Hypothetical protein GL50803_11304 [Giardia lamblia ATCC 50803]
MLIDLLRMPLAGGLLGRLSCLSGDFPQSLVLFIEERLQDVSTERRPAELAAVGTRDFSLLAREVLGDHTGNAVDLFAGLCAMGGIRQLLNAEGRQPVPGSALVTHDLRASPVCGVEAASDATVGHLGRAAL